MKRLVAAGLVALAAVFSILWVPGSAAPLAPIAHSDSSTISPGSAGGAPRHTVPATHPDFLPPIGFQWDDNYAEDSIGLGNTQYNEVYPAIWLNQFHLAGHPRPVTIDQIHIVWPGPEAGNFVGQPIRLLAYLDVNADGNPRDAGLVHISERVIQVADWTTPQVFPVNIAISSPGDLYVGWEDMWAEPYRSPRWFPAAQDQTYSHYHSWIAYNEDSYIPNIHSLGGNSDVARIDDYGLPGNWMIRMYGSSYSSPTPIPVATNTPTNTPTPVPPRCPDQRYTDVCPGDFFYVPVNHLSTKGIVSGYNTAPPCDGPLHIPCFKPFNSLTRGQTSKILSQAAGFSDPPGAQRFQDVPPGHTFYDWIQRLAARGVIGGYPCGTRAEEPCVPPGNLPYFRPGANVTRGQVSKMIAETFGFAEPVSGQRFQDVPPTHTFYLFIERMAVRGIIGGYPCGARAEEPCVPPGNLPYFRPSIDVTRGQSSKMVYETLLQVSPTATPMPSNTSTPTATLTPTDTATASPTEVLPTVTSTATSTARAVVR